MERMLGRGRYENEVQRQQRMLERKGNVKRRNYLTIDRTEEEEEREERGMNCTSYTTDDQLFTHLKIRSNGTVNSTFT